MTESGLIHASNVKTASSTVEVSGRPMKSLVPLNERERSVVSVTPGPLARIDRLSITSLSVAPPVRAPNETCQSLLVTVVAYPGNA